MTWVPPSMVKVEGEGAHIITGRTACTTNAQLPWLPMSTLCKVLCIDRAAWLHTT